MTDFDNTNDDIKRIEEAVAPIPLTPGKLVSNMTGVYVPPKLEHRNDGNKHIPSRGNPT
jgi:hypothetical protein